MESFRGDDGPYDLVVMLQVIAHLVDPLATGRRIAELLRPDGLWLVETWDRESRTARLFGRRWHEYSPPSVLHWFSRRGRAAGHEGSSHGVLIASGLIAGEAIAGVLIAIPRAAEIELPTLLEEGPLMIGLTVVVIAGLGLWMARADRDAA